MKIVIWTGGALETWGSHSIVEGGIGGSETAAIRMAAHQYALVVHMGRRGPHSLQRLLHQAPHYWNEEEDVEKDHAARSSVDRRGQSLRTSSLLVEDKSH